MGNHITFHESGKITYTSKNGTRVHLTQSSCDQIFGPGLKEGAARAAKGSAE